MNGQTVAVKAKVLSLAATASAPAWFLEIIGTTAATGAVSGSIDLSNGNMDLSVSLALGGLKLFDTAGVSVSLNTVAIGFKKVGSTLTSTLAASSNLVLPQLSGSATTSIPIIAGLTFSNTDPASLTGSLTVTGDWTNAFGVSGLIVKNLSVAVTLAKAKPSIGLAGVVTLPTDWSSKLGLAPGVPITLVAALGGLSSCFGIEIGQAGGTATVLDVANMGAVTAKHVKLYVSPTGCTVGTASVPAGVQMNFDGAVLGVGLTANLSITPSPFRLQGDIALGDISVSGLTLKGVAATVDVSQLSQAFTFKGDITVLGASAKVTGSAFKTPTTLGIDFTGTFAVNLDGYFQGAMDVSFMYRKTGQSTSLTAKSTANGTLLGQTYSINWGFTFANGVVTKMNGTAAIDVKFGELATITGNGSFEYEAGAYPKIDFTGTMTLLGRPFSAVEGKVTRGGVTLTAFLNVADVVTARVSGAIAFQNGGGTTLKMKDELGVEADARPGDFRFDATNITIKAAGFNIAGSVSVGNVRGSRWATVAGTAKLGIDEANVEVSVKGTFTSGGDFSLEGSGAVSLGGLPAVSATFTIKNQARQVTVSGKAAVTIPSVGQLLVTGFFSRNDQGTTYDISGEAAFRPGGLEVANAKFRVRNSGVSGSGRIAIPSFAAVNVTFSIPANGAIDIDAAVGFSSPMNTILGNPTANIRFHNGPERVCRLQGLSSLVCSDVETHYVAFKASVTNVLKIPGSFLLSGSVSDGGVYDVNLRVTLGPYGGSTDFFFCTGWYSAKGDFGLKISGSPSSLTIGVELFATLGAGCGSLTSSIGAGINFTYTAPISFALRLFLSMSFGAYTWNPTIYNA